MDDLEKSKKSDSQQISASSEIYGSFYLNSGEYALPVKNIQEVVNPPSKYLPMPLAPPYLLGVFNLRGSVIPVIDLKIILKLEDSLHDENKATPSPTLILESRKIAIVEWKNVKVGLVFDRTGEIFRIKDNQNEFSEFKYSNSESHKNVISGAIKLEGGKRIVQILDALQLVSLDQVPQSLDQDPKSNLKKREINHRGGRKQCISFVIGNSRCGFEIEAIQEIIHSPELKEVAFASNNCIGTCDLRGDPVPVVDFASLLKYRKPQDKSAVNESQRIFIVKIGKDRLGLLVDSVENIIIYYSEDILSFPVLSQEKSSMFVGCLSRPDAEDILLLNHNEILSNTELNEITQGHSKIYQSSTSNHLAQLEKKKNRKSYITFQIDNLLALSILEVREIINFPKELLTPPGLPKCIRGILNLRGKMVSILDTRILYGAENQKDYQTAKVLIFEKRGLHFGMIVDSVQSIISFSDDEKIELPDLLYRSNDHKGITEDIKFAVEVEMGTEKKALLVLNLEPLAERTGLACSPIDVAPGPLAA